MSILSFIKGLLGQTPEPTPDESIPCNPFVPWEIYADTHPYLLRCLQGEEEGWVMAIWYPYWLSLSPSEQEALKMAAPTDEWREWIDLRHPMALSYKRSYEDEGLQFDYRPYLDDFIREYRLNRMAQRKWKEKQCKKKRNP